MTGRTHDLAALTTLTIYLATQNLPTLSLATGVVAIGANLIGGIAPDIDQPTSKLWHKVPAGSLIGKIIDPLMGNHRMLSHSLLGFALFGFLFNKLLLYVHTFLLVDINMVWWAFMFGFGSHLIMDTVTKEGVPWFFPIPIRLGIPPFKFLRMETGGIIEKFIVFPGLLIANGYIIFANYGKFIEFVTKHIMK